MNWEGATLPAGFAKRLLLVDVEVGAPKMLTVELTGMLGTTFGVTTAAVVVAVGFGLNENCGRAVEEDAVACKNDGGGALGVAVVAAI